MAVVQKIRCQVRKIIPHGNHVYTLALKPANLVPRFKPGQFLHLALDDYDPSGFWPESRVFSIASLPENRDNLLISYSVRGSFTSRMEREIKKGMQVWVKLPYGDFVIEGAKDVVLFAGGTGISAFTAYIGGLTKELSNNVYLAYGAREEDLLIYRKLIEEQVKKIPFLHVLYFSENDGAAFVEKGKLSVKEIWPKIKAPQDTVFYISGPPAMLKTLREELSDLGILRDNIKIDAWE
jgi:ferredoxin-NADP reductase